MNASPPHEVNDKYYSEHSVFGLYIQWLLACVLDYIQLFGMIGVVFYFS